MANLFIAYNNAFDSATLSGGSWETTLPLANLQKQQPTTIARTTNDAESSTKLTADLGSRQNIKVVALIHHNLSSSATWRVEISNVSDFSALEADSGTIDAVDTLEAYGTLDWGDFTWGGKLTDTELEAFNPIAFYFLETPENARYVRITIQDTDNPDNYVEMGRVFIAPAFAPSSNVEYGLRAGFIDNSRSVISRGGQVYVDSVPARRRFDFRFHHMTENEAYTGANEMQRVSGLSGDVLMAIDVDDTTHRMRQSCYGRLINLQPIIHAGNAHFTLDISIEELL